MVSDRKRWEGTGGEEYRVVGRDRGRWGGIRGGRVGQGALGRNRERWEGTARGEKGR